MSGNSGGGASTSTTNDHRTHDGASNRTHTVLITGAAGHLGRAVAEAFAAQGARLVLLQMDKLRGDLGEFARGLKGQLRLLCNTSALSEFLPEALGTFLDAFCHRVGL